MTAAAPTVEKPASDDLFGHPRGLSVLFATEMWERFSYYGMASLLSLYLVDYLLVSGHVERVVGYTVVKGAMESVFGPLAAQPFAAQLVGLFTGLAYFMPVFGGYIADRWLGQRVTAVIGALLMAVGHFLMAMEQMLFFALAFLTHTDLKTLPLGLYQFFGDDSVDWGAVMAASVVTTLPVFLLFLPIQGKISPGRMAGAVK